MNEIQQALALAAQFRKQGNVAEAERLYREILARQPAEPAALHLLGTIALEQGKPAEAIDLISRAVDAVPDNAQYLTHLGTAQAMLSQWGQAAHSFRRAAVIDPKSAGAQYNLGIVEYNQGQIERAAASFQRAAAVDPTRAEPFYNLANISNEMGRLDVAERCYREAIRRRPGFLMALNNMANLLRGQHRLEEAVELLRQAVALQPDYAFGYHNLGTALADLGRFDEALGCFSQALAIDPKLSLAHDHLGMMLQTGGRYAEALVCHEQALQLSPQLADAHFNRAMIWLLRGDLEGGWTEYEWRWKCKNFKPFAGPQPRWDGGLLEGRTILLQAEQGLGDTLHFVRYAPLVHKRGGRVVLQCQSALVRLLTGCPSVDTVVPLDAPIPECDVYAPLLSLPGIFDTRLENIPNQVPYLSADPQLVQQWAQRLATFDGFRVGITWQGNPKYNYDRLRSVALKMFRPLANVPGVRLFSLQKGFGTEQISAAAGHVHLVDLDSQLDRDAGPFMDTAAVMKNLDLVITSDNAVPHLAGALGVPVWVALPHLPDWRWLLDREDSPWYPTMRLFRQETAGDWDGVFQRIASALQPLATATKAR